MSVRAYRVIKIERAKNSTFNLWHDTELCEFLGVDVSGGMWEAEVVRLEEAVKELKLDEEIAKKITEDIMWAKNRGDDFILYECF